MLRSPTAAFSAVLRCLVFALLAASLVACSTAARVAYSNAPFAGAWLVDDWFDLHEGQREWVMARIARFQAWHRVSELPEYEKLLQDTAARAATRLGEDDARRIYREMRVLYHRMVRRAIPDLADFLLQLHPEQVTYLERKYAENNEKTMKEFGRGTPRERQEARAKRFLEQFEDWTGRLSGAQRDLVRARVAAIPDITDDWMGDRRLRQAETLSLLRARPSREEMMAGLTRILIDTDSWRRPEYAAKLRARDEQMFALIGALDATLTPEQRAKFHRRLSNYAADVAYLMVAN